MIEIFEVVQVCLSVYILYYIVLGRMDWWLVTMYVFITVLFAWLKLSIIPYELWGILDWLLWGTYNVLFSLFVLFILIETKDDWNDTPISKGI